jgi:hypothetical protein
MVSETVEVSLVKVAEAWGTLVPLGVVVRVSVGIGTGPWEKSCQPMIANDRTNRAPRMILTLGSLIQLLRLMALPERSSFNAFRRIARAFS